jgi:hypothetical protein
MLTGVAVFALVLAYVALTAAYLALRTLARLRRAATVLGTGGGGRESIIEAAERHIALTTAVAGQLDSLRADLDATRSETATGVQAGHSALNRHLAHIEAQVEADTARALRNVALVRYDAFDDMAGRMSFSLALLDDRGDGVTLTAIAGRSDTRVYAKGVHAGAGEHDLSPEEVQAVGAAMRRPSAKQTAKPTTRSTSRPPTNPADKPADKSRAKSDRAGFGRRKAS